MEGLSCRINGLRVVVTDPPGCEETECHLRLLDRDLHLTLIWTRDFGTDKRFRVVSFVWVLEVCYKSLQSKI